MSFGKLTSDKLAKTHLSKQTFKIDHEKIDQEYQKPKFSIKRVNFENGQLFENGSQNYFDSV